MWTATVAVALLAGLTVVAGYEVHVRVPSEPGYGEDVVLECDYRLDAGESINFMAWLKDGKDFLTYRDGEQPSFTLIDGINIDVLSSTQRRIVLTDVQDSASGTYGVRMSINRDGNANTYSHDQDMLVGGGAADTLGNRFGGRPQRQPASSSSSTTFVSASSSSSGSSGVPAGPVGGGLGNRFGGRPAAAVPAAAAPAVGQSAVSGLASAQNELQNAVNQLQNALNSALG